MALDPRDPRVQRLLRERQLVAEAEARAEQRRLAEEQEDLAKKIKTAEVMGLSEAEKEEYLAQEAPSLKAKIDESSTAMATPAPEAESPTSGIGPLASGQKYSSLLDALKDQQTKGPADTSVSPEAESKSTELMRSSSTTNKKQTGTQASGQNDIDISKAGSSSALGGTTGANLEVAKPEDTLLARLQKAETGREEARKRADIGQLAEMLGKSLTQIGAAQQGMRTGVDLSGIAQGKGIDWEARRAEIAKDYETELASVSKEREQLLEKERRAEEANNQKQLIELKKQEFGLAQRETNARIDKLRAEASAVKEAAGKPDSKLAIAALERAEKRMDDLNKGFDKSQKLNIGINKTVDEIVKARKEGRSTAALERGIITTYLKQLDPDSAVLAAEQLAFIEAGNREAFLNALQSKDDKALSAFISDTALGRMSESKLNGLKDAANLQFANEKDAYYKRVRPILRSAYEGGVTNVYQILGREPAPEELDEVTSRFWGGKQAAQPAEGQTGAGVAQPTSKVAGVKKARAADLK